MVASGAPATAKAGTSSDMLAAQECTENVSVAAAHAALVSEMAAEVAEVTPNYAHYSKATSAFWKKRLAGEGLREWYGKAAEWWLDKEKAPSSVDGVLGGYGNLDGVDVKESEVFLGKVRDLLSKAGHKPGRARALDGGAGIGRVTKHLLSRFFDCIDLVEGNCRLMDAVPEFLGPGYKKYVGEQYCTTLQDFAPSPGRYDCIWVQWVVIYFTDFDFVAFLRRCARALVPGGFIVIKENVLDVKEAEDFIVDEEDSSLTRSKGYMRHIFREANLEVFLEKPQVKFPENMFPVLMYALRPVGSGAADLPFSVSFPWLGVS